MAFACSLRRWFGMMTDSQRRLPIGRRLPALAVLAANVLAAPAVIRADIIIDDFVDDLRMDVPEDNWERVLDEGIGDLGGYRTTQVRGLQTDLVGFVDINQTRPSALTAQIPRAERSGSGPFAWVSLDYAFTAFADAVDLTESGKNNAVFLTFEHLTAAIPLNELRVSVNDPNASHYSSRLIPIPQNSSPFTLVFPFDTFVHDRGFPSNEFVFANARELDVLFSIARVNPNLPPQIDFELVLTEVRVGRVVPEPSTLVGFAWLAAWSCGLRWRGSVLHRSFRKGVRPWGYDHKL